LKEPLKEPLSFWGALLDGPDHRSESTTTTTKTTTTTTTRLVEGLSPKKEGLNKLATTEEVAPRLPKKSVNPTTISGCSRG
jgi:hypothetical protein